MVQLVHTSTNEVGLLYIFVTKEVYQMDQGGYMDKIDGWGLPRRLNRNGVGIEMNKEGFMFLLHMLTTKVTLMDLFATK